jgi:hypothetical protein
MRSFLPHTSLGIRRAALIPRSGSNSLLPGHAAVARVYRQGARRSIPPRRPLRQTAEGETEDSRVFQCGTFACLILQGIQKKNR